MFQQALVSVSDKVGLADFLKPLVLQGLKVFSTGGTAEHLRSHGIEVVNVSDMTGFPEVMDGRVKTLHPHIYMSLLADQKNQSHLETLKNYQLKPFDLVICNLYPFEETIHRTSDLKNWIENIDIGGPAQIRAAAKNFQTVTVLVDPKDYPLVQSGNSEPDLRKKLAAKAFRHVSAYDSLIGNSLSALEDCRDDSLGGAHVQTLRYGENSQQSAQWYRQRGEKNGLHQSQILQGKELSYNNLLDLDSAVRCLQALGHNQLVGVIVKHTNPCAVAVATNAQDLIAKLLKCDPVSMFGGICAFNHTIDQNLAVKLCDVFFECLIAPEYTAEAIEVFKTKKNLRVLRWLQMSQINSQFEYRSILGGYLKQSSDHFYRSWLQNDYFQSEGEQADALMAEVCAGFLKSNAIAIVRNGQSLGFGMGQTNRVDAVDQAIQRARKFHGTLAGAVLASDAFFPFSDSIDLIAESGINLIIQPGGSLRDSEVMAAAQRHQIRMVMTGERHFKH